MKSYPANYTLQKNRTDGAHSVYILRLTIAGLDYWISGDAMTIMEFAGSTPWPADRSIDVAALAKPFGTIQWGISGALAESQVSEFSSTLLLGVDLSPNLIAVTQYHQHATGWVQLYAPLSVGTSYPLTFSARSASSSYIDVAGYYQPDEIVYLTPAYVEHTITVVPIGGTNNLSVYFGAADIDIINLRLTPLPLRDLEYLATADLLDNAPMQMYEWYAGCTDPPQMVFSGKISELAEMTDTTIPLRFRDESADLQKFYIGRNVTLAAYPNALPADVGKFIRIPFGPVSKAPALCVNQTATYIYIYSDRPVTSVPAVYARNRGKADINITAHCTRYTGQPSQELAGYEDKGIISITAGQAASIQALVNLVLTDGISVPAGSHSHAATATREQYPSSASPVAVGAWASATDAVVESVTFPTISGIIEQSLQVDYSVSNAKKVIIDGQFVVYDSASAWTGSGTYTWTTSGTGNGTSVRGENSGATVQVKVNVAHRSVFYANNTSADPAAGVQKNGTVTLTQPAPADAVSEQILVDMVADSGSPSGMATWVLAQAGKPAVTVVGALAVSTFGGQIDSYDTAQEWLNAIAWQCGAWFAYPCGTPKLISRAGSGQSKVIPDVLLDSSGSRMLTRKKTPPEELIDNITIRYSRDWSLDRAADSYQKTASGTTGTGTHDQPDLFWMDMITAAADANALVALFLAQFGTRKWLAECYETLEHSEMEFGDTAVLSFLGKTGIITAPEHAPGSVEEAGKIKLTVRY